jgi:hypothetical protein
MPIEIQCGSCGAKYSVNERFAGKNAKCRACGAIMHVPGAPLHPTGSSPMLDSPLIERPVVSAMPRPRPVDPSGSHSSGSHSGMRPMAVPQPTPRASSPGEPMILSSNAAEYVQADGGGRKHWSKHLSKSTWVIIGVVTVVLLALGLILLFDPTVFFPSYIPAH